MGMYTDFRLKTRVKDSFPIVPTDRVGTLSSAVVLPDHDFFLMERSNSILGHAYLREGVLEIMTDLKNYNREIQNFVSWLDPYIMPSSYSLIIGYYIYEEDYIPTLLWSPGAARS